MTDGERGELANKWGVTPIPNRAAVEHACSACEQLLGPRSGWSPTRTGSDRHTAAARAFAQADWLNSKRVIAFA